MVTLAGAGGMGKTRLAARVADGVGRAFPDGCWIVDVGAVPDGALLGPAVARALGLHTTAVDVVQEVLAFLTPRSALLILDGCERLLDACARLTDDLRVACPQLRILATSREPLHRPGEQVVRVAPLTIPPPEGAVSPESLGHYESVSLYCDRAAEVSGFELTDDNAEAVARLCAQLQGVPLAIELAAARTVALSPQAILDQLTDRFRLLSNPHSVSAERHRSVRACAAWSYDLCSESEQALWRRLSVFAGGCDLPTVETACAGGAVSPDDVLDVLVGLVEKSILYVVPGDDPHGDVRYRMLDDLAAFGLEALAATGDLERWQRRHLEWCADLAAGFRSGWVGPEQASWLRRMRAEHDNLLAALSQCAADHDLAALGFALTMDLDQFWLAAGWLAEARHWWEIALSSGAGSPRERVVAGALSARFAAMQHDLPVARSSLDQAWAEAERLGTANETDMPTSNEVRASLLLPEAMLTVWAGDRMGAVRAAEKAVEMLGSRDENMSLRLTAWEMLGTFRGFAGDREGSITAHKQCIALAEGAGEAFRRSASLAGVAEQELAAGELAAAAEGFAAALAMKAELGDRFGVALGLDSLGRVALARGDADGAATLLGAAAAIWDEIGMSETQNPFATATTSAEAMRACRRLLGKRAFRRAYRRGAALGTANAVAQALGRTVDVAKSGAPSGEISPLTRRENEVADLVAEGLTNPQIAERLVISVRTVQGHVENILRKLGVGSRSLIASWVTERRTSASRLAELPEEP